MHNVVRYIVARSYKPLLEKYLLRQRSYTYKQTTIRVLPGVFHPGFFCSTSLLLSYIEKLPLQGKTLLEPGAGTGLIAITAAKKGAKVTATDINPEAVRNCRLNALINGVEIEIITSDLFDNIPPTRFDIIAINPPYYKKDPASPAEYAWYCGQDGLYFKKLFSGLYKYMHSNTETLMTLCDGCDIETIMNMAVEKGFEPTLVTKKKNLVETHYLFKLERLVHE